MHWKINVFPNTEILEIHGKQTMRRDQTSKFDASYFEHFSRQACYRKHTSSFVVTTLTILPLRLYRAVERSMVRIVTIFLALKSLVSQFIMLDSFTFQYPGENFDIVWVTRIWRRKKETARLKLNISELSNIEKFYNQTELNLGCMQHFIPE